nr:lytic transglycosylase domain-containing protein [Streptomyces smaragdinus]
MVALTASQAPGLADTPRPKPRVADLPPGQPTDTNYHTELPPLAAADPTTGRPAAPQLTIGEQQGIPATVLAAYKHAERKLRGSDPGCRLPWELLAAIGKVESGHAQGGRVDANGTTRAVILGPMLTGEEFARITDTDDGLLDGDKVWDRAVGPMQFIPSTWARWGADGNGDGQANPNNVYDAALAAGQYLCAGQRNLSVSDQLNAAILSYNNSNTYLATVLSWLAFYRSGVHSVPDGLGVLPTSPGAGNPKTEESGDYNGDGKKDPGIIIGPQPSPSPTPPSTGGNPLPGLPPDSQPPTDDPTDPTEDPTTDPTDPTEDPTDPTEDPTTDPTDDPTEDPTTDPTTDPTEDPTTDPTTDPTEDPVTTDPTADPCVDPADPACATTDPGGEPPSP